MKTELRVNVLGALVMTALLFGVAAAPESPLADAAMQGDAEAVRELLDRGADVNAPQGDGMTALHWAAYRGDVGVAELLMRAGADVKTQTRIGSYTPLHLASQAASAPLVEMLVEAGGDVHARTTNSGATVLHLAATAGSRDAVATLLERGAEVDVREPAWGQTPLMFAAAANRAEVVEELLAGGADPAITTTVIDVPRREMAEARANDRLTEILKAIEDEGRDPTSAEVQQAVQAKREVQRTTSDREFTPEVDENGYPPGTRDYEQLVGSWGGLTALMHAIRQGHSEAAMALIDGGADIDQVSAGDHTSPLLMATINGQYDLALHLIERGADPTLESDAGAGPLYTTINTQWHARSRYPQPQEHEGQTASYLDVMKALLEAGADPDVRLEKHLWYMEFTFAQWAVDTGGSTPFWRAAHALDVPAMKLLLAYGADWTIPTRKPGNAPSYGARNDKLEDQSGLPDVPIGGLGVTPFHASSGFASTSAGRAANHQRTVPDGWLPAVKFFLEELGADVNEADFMGFTPLHHAAGRGNLELAQYLLSKGANPLAMGRSGHTTVDFANAPETGLTPFPDVIELLESVGARKNLTCGGTVENSGRGIYC